ncbi:hypothetical protein Patl1_09053 [Pistacia atlantica]|uniref:Uncharacterized protein n=1 Tax=Pistacia atlantica TaxID=434234 RepID=A0ACC1AJC2_9ROSI|nr:hypothetical protein Patl1_09053 [Pistacia atlantica]
MALYNMNVAGQGQTDTGLNQRTGVVDADGGLSCGKTDTKPSSLNPLLASPQPTQQKCQRGSVPSMETDDERSISDNVNALTYSHFKGNDTKVDGRRAAVHMSDQNVVERLDSNSLAPSDKFLNLEFTLGRPSWQMDYAESSKELTLLKC